jgi:hypothetical protein
MEKAKKKLRVILGNRQRFALACLIFALVAGGLIFSYYYYSQTKKAKETSDDSAQDYRQLSGQEQIEQTIIPEDASPEYKSAHYQTIAIAYWSTDQTKALNYLLMAEVLTPNDKNLLYNIARLYQQMNNPEKQAEYENKAGKQVETQSAPNNDGGVM